MEMSSSVIGYNRSNPITTISVEGKISQISLVYDDVVICPQLYY